LKLLDKPTQTYDARELSRKAIQNWPWVWNHLVDMHARPLGEVQRLNPNFVALETGVRRHNAPRAVEFRGPDGWPNEGAWRCLGNGASGADTVDLVAYLGECDRRTAALWLAGLLSRIVEVAA
jgi:hypothetical protein